MKKIFCILTVFVCLSALLCIPVSASNNISDVTINVTLDSEGNAYVVQRWKGDFNEATECYYSIKNLQNGISVDDFSVWQNGKYFEHIDDWNIDASREEKEGKCGIVETDDGYELCYGIGEYGNNTYNFGYTIKGLIGAYDDMDGFNFQFWSPEMGNYPTNLKITIESENSRVRFKDSISDIYVFGCKNEIRFKNGAIVAKTTSPIDSEEQYMNIVVGVDKGFFMSTRDGKESSFNKLVENAKEGSTYEDDDMTGFIVVAIMAVIAALIIAVIFLIRKLEISRFYKACDYFRDAPCNDEMNEAYFLSGAFGLYANEGSIMAACLLELINKGCLEPVNETSVGFMGREKKTISLRLSGMPTDHSRPSTALYNILFKAAGEDGVLQEKELEKYSKKNPEVLREFIDNTKAKGEALLENKNAFCGSHNQIKGLAETGKKELSELMGYKKYLLDFSLIAERSVNEVHIWEEMLVYAALFDVSDKVMDELKKVYPDKILEFQTYDNNLWLALTFHNATYNAMHSAEMAASAGSGGVGSLTGGGGFMGGGGGGTR